MLDSLTLLAPGDARPAGRSALVLLDRRGYEAALFTRVAREVIAGPGIECETSDAGPVFRVGHAEVLEVGVRLDAHVLFFAATDTDVKTLAPVAKRCRRATFIVHPDQDDTAIRSLEFEKLDFERNVPGGRLPQADAALLGSDWSVVRREFIRRCRRASMPTLSLQEAVNVDFDGAPHRMRWADSVCLSGPQALRYLSREVSFLTGNPRFDGYAPALLPVHDKPLVLINCNFILGIGGERGPAWMEQAISVMRDLNLDFRITKHPRDDTDLSAYPNVMPSGAYKVRDQLAACSVLVSRDSSLPYEALLTGRPVIYFDPFYEKERTLREDESGLVQKCDTTDGLRAALREVRPLPVIPARGDAADDPFTFIFTEPGAGATDRVVRALHALTKWPDRYRTADALEDHGARAAVREWTELHLRPKLRQIGPLRKIWRAARRLGSPR